MSEFLAEATVLIRPDTTKFRATLVAELEAATKGIVVPVTVVAAAAGTRSAQAAAAATTTLTATKQEQAAADALAAREAATLTHAQELEAAAVERLAAVEQAGALATTELAAAKARLRAAEIALVAARKANVAALATENAELRANTAATLQDAEAMVAAARAAALEGVAHAKAGKEAAGHAAAEHALARGVAFTGASMTGLRGATLAASGAFVVGAVAVTALEKSIHEASAEAEAGASVMRVFGEEIGGNLERNAAKLADTFGVSTKTALQFEAQLGNTFTQAKFGTEQAASMSEQLVKLAADMAAFKNVPIETALKAITLGLVGNSRGLRQFQVQLNQARVDEEALRETGKKHAKGLTDLDRLQARFNLILEQTTNQQGSAARRANELAQREKTLSANLQNLGGTLGRITAGPLADFIGEINDGIGGLKRLKDAVGQIKTPLDDGGNKAGIFGRAIGFAFSSGGAQIRLFKRDFDNMIEAFRGGPPSVEGFTGANLHAAAVLKFLQGTLESIIGSVEGFTAEVHKAQIAGARLNFDNAVRQLTNLQEAMVGIKIAGGSATDELTNLAKQEAAARKELAAAESSVSLTQGESGHATAIARRRAAKDALLAIITEERQIQQEQADAAKSAADEIIQRAQEAAQALADAIAASDQAFLDAFAQQDVETNIAGIKAQMTKSLVDDLAVTELERKRILAQIAEAKRSIIDSKTLREFLNEKRVELAQVNLAQKQIEEQQRQNAADRKRARISRASESIELDIELAQTNKDIRAEIRARNRKILFDQERLKSVRGDIIATKQLRNDIAEQRAEIKKLKGDVDQRRKDLEALEFSFLQTQSGFVANLLSNLLPQGAVAGTVGGGAINTPTAIPSPERTRPPDVGAGVTAEAAKTSTRGASSGQMSALITINRGMLAVLQRIAGQRTHPEATNQRHRQSVELDTV